MGPLFAVGHVIFCAVPEHLFGLDPGQSLLQLGFILEAEDPRYKIHLVNGATVWTNTTESWLQLRWAQDPGTEFAGDQDNLFANLQSNLKLQIGLYSLHVDL